MIESTGSIIAENIIDGIKLLLGSHHIWKILLLIHDAFDLACPFHLNIHIYAWWKAVLAATTNPLLFTITEWSIWILTLLGNRLINISRICVTCVHEYTMQHFCPGGVSFYFKCGVLGKLIEWCKPCYNFDTSECIRHKRRLQLKYIS